MKIKTLVIASALSLVAGSALAGQAPVFEHDHSSGDSGTRLYVYEYAAPQPQLQQPLVEGRAALSTSSFFANQPVLLQDGDGLLVYDYSHRAPQPRQ